MLINDEDIGDDTDVDINCNNGYSNNDGNGKVINIVNNINKVM